MPQQEGQEIMMLLGLVGERVGKMMATYGGGGMPEQGLPPEMMGPPPAADLLAAGPQTPQGLEMGGMAPQGLEMGGMAPQSSEVGGLPLNPEMAGMAPPASGPLGPEEMALLQMLGQGGGPPAPGGKPPVGLPPVMV